METIYIPQLLKAPERKEEIKIGEFITGLNTLTPVRGLMVITHGGNFLEVFVEAETIVTLTCDRCLQQYNHKLSIDSSELILLEKEEENLDSLPLEREVSLEDLSETLDPNGYFEPDTWLYEQLCLAMPIRQLCGKNCQQPASISDEKDTSLLDNRWSALANLKQQLSQ